MEAKEIAERVIQWAPETHNGIGLKELAQAYLDLLEQLVPHKYGRTTACNLTKTYNDLIEEVIELRKLKPQENTVAEPTEKMWTAALRQDPSILKVPGMCKMRLELFFNTMTRASKEKV